jgi:hypothetical protein
MQLHAELVRLVADPPLAVAELAVGLHSSLLKVVEHDL